MAKYIIDEEKLNRIINEAIQRVINESKEKERHRAMSAEDLQQLGIVYFDFKIFTSEEIARTLCYVFDNIKLKDDKTSDFYCGITNDIVK